MLSYISIVRCISFHSVASFVLRKVKILLFLSSSPSRDFDRVHTNVWEPCQSLRTSFYKLNFKGLLVVYWLTPWCPCPYLSCKFWGDHQSLYTVGYFCGHSHYIVIYDLVHQGELLNGGIGIQCAIMIEIGQIRLLLSRLYGVLDPDW